ncbi:MAG: hypothetical protein GWP05_02995 [Anaerolineaceae bacterium]|nr:hypothetical protein [Anaerolineaceae bacterium]
MRKNSRHCLGRLRQSGAGHKWLGGWRALAAAALALACTGCAGLGMTSREVELLEAATADARFVDRAWAGLEPEERRDFVRANALRWGYFNDLAHGHQPALGPNGRPAMRPTRAEGGAQDE